MIDTAYRVVADHIRTLCIAISDGGEPDKDGRGYVLRLVLRRAIRFSEDYLGAPVGFFPSLVPIVVEQLGDAFPELKKDPQHVIDVLTEEETQFRRTLRRGTQLFKRAADKVPEGGKLSGETAWELWGTYGFPVDLTKLMAEERGLEVDVEAYEAAKEAAVEQSRLGKRTVVAGLDLEREAIEELQEQGVPRTNDAAKYDYAVAAAGGAKYNFADTEAKILSIRIAGAFTDAVNADEAGEDVQAALILDATNFYAEQGGQVYDTGYMTDASGTVDFTVSDVQLRGGTYVLHIGTLRAGSLKVGDTLKLSIDGERRTPIMANHTGTHVLNYALRKVLGEADQMGSHVDDERLRFDFSCKKAMTADQLRATEAHVRELVASWRIWRPRRPSTVCDTCLMKTTPTPCALSAWA